MKNIELVVHELEEYYYEQKLKEDPNVMSFSYEGYHYDTGCIGFLKGKWKTLYGKRR